MVVKHEKSPLIFSNRNAVTEKFSSVINQPATEDEEDDGFEYSAEDLQRNSKPRYKLMIYDCTLAILEYIQYFALLQSLSLRWSWPSEWVNKFSFLFLFNLDIWDFVKVVSGAFVEARDYITPSDDVPINFKAWILIFLVFIIIFVILYHGVAKYLLYREMTHAIPAGNFLKRVMITVMQVFALPVGVNFGKIFWCDTTGVLNVANDVQCWNTEHCVYIVLVSLVFLLYFLVYGYWLFSMIRAQVVSHNNKQHEAYLQLKDTEAMFKLDGTWNYRLFFIFASFRRRWVYARVILHLVKFVAIAMYCGLYQHRLAQIIVITGIFFILTPITLLPQQFRVGSFNILACLCWFCLSAFGVIGCLLNMDNLHSVYVTANYVLGELILFSVIWLIGTVVLLTYFILRGTGILFASRDFWPTMISKKTSKLPESMQRYMHAAVHARFTMQKATSLPALLAPVHEISHQIHVINALACEAEYLNDPLQNSLRSVLDDLIVLHTRVVGPSLFSESLKPSTKSNLDALLKVIPDLTRRLNQREFDFILMSPLKRRLLFKMFVVSCFLPRENRSDAVPINEEHHSFWKKTSSKNKPIKKKSEKLIEFDALDEGFDEIEIINDYADENV